VERISDLEIIFDRNGTTPLYDQVARELERAIADGRLRKGSQLENEVRLADRWGLSRLTVRRAIQQLVDSGLLVRRRGVGTQVVNEQSARPQGLGSLFDDLIEAGRFPTTTVLTHERVIADSHIAEKLGIPCGSDVVFLERCRYANGRRLAIMRSWLIVDAAGDLTTNALASAGLYQLLRDAGTWPHSSRRSIAAKAASPVDAALLGIPVGAPILMAETTMQDRSGRTVEVSEHVYAGADYTMELSVVES
jgi:DNA-binding GntR family transcriptional regulator